VTDVGEELLSNVFDVGQVVVEGTHVLAKFSVGAASLLRGGNRFTGSSLKFTVKPDHRFERVIAQGLTRSYYW
jgi:hypothetical protein